MVPRAALLSICLYVVLSVAAPTPTPSIANEATSVSSALTKRAHPLPNYGDQGSSSQELQRALLAQHKVQEQLIHDFPAFANLNVTALTLQLVKRYMISKGTHPSDADVKKLFDLLMESEHKGILR
ncbi:hypothetical protein FRB94_000398 [Tulasnella sp. JGI-2019a]|nr:hypothetical protein FRB93_009826 [Tulasnella sp. JGI-2019a]KAG9006802.1 hypothetical protein FRB94_000398 [Tulasnella sp. JGI-2019a]